MMDVVPPIGHRPADTEARIPFEGRAGLARALTGGRLERLRHVRRHPAGAIAELGRTLGRDYKRVHDDVEIPAAAGLLDRTEEGIVRTAGDEIRAVIALDPAA